MGALKILLFSTLTFRSEGRKKNPPQFREGIAGDREKLLSFFICFNNYHSHNNDKGSKSEQESVVGSGGFECVEEPKQPTKREHGHEEVLDHFEHTIGYGFSGEEESEDEGGDGSGHVADNEHIQEFVVREDEVDDGEAGEHRDEEEDAADRCED